MSLFKFENLPHDVDGRLVFDKFGASKADIVEVDLRDAKSSRYCNAYVLLSSALRVHTAKDVARSLGREVVVTPKSLTEKDVRKIDAFVREQKQKRRRRSRSAHHGTRSASPAGVHHDDNDDDDDGGDGRRGGMQRKARRSEFSDIDAPSALLDQDDDRALRHVGGGGGAALRDHLALSADTAPIPPYTPSLLSPPQHHHHTLALAPPAVAAAAAPPPPLPPPPPPPPPPPSSAGAGTGQEVLVCVPWSVCPPDIARSSLCVLAHLDRATGVLAVHPDELAKLYATALPGGEATAAPAPPPLPPPQLQSPPTSAEYQLAVPSYSHPYYTERGNNNERGSNARGRGRGRGDGASYSRGGSGGGGGRRPYGS